MKRSVFATIGLIGFIAAAFIAAALTKVEQFVSEQKRPSVEQRGVSLVCAYYAFRHDPRLDLRKNIIELYQLEWRKKTRAVGLPYVYEYLFFEMHYYVQFQKRRNVDITYRDLLEFIMPYVREIYIKDERLLPYSAYTPSSEPCNLDEIVEPVDPPDFPPPDDYIYNRNSGRFYKPRDIPPNDRAGNNTPEMRP